MDIKDFPLSWRWTSPSHAVLPAEVLISMNPLPPEEAARLYRRGEQLFSQKGTATKESCPSEEVEPTRRWLADLPVASDQRVCVAWDTSMAISLPWKAFVRYWDDFCYPSSDDLYVFPSNEGMALAWDHEEVFTWVQDAV
jgi:hypothetical protein